MSANFDWKTEEDFDWDHDQDEGPPEQPRGGRRRWVTIALLLAIIGGMTAFLVRQLDQRVDENTQAMRRDVLSSHNLLQFAEEEQDDELFFSLLSGRDSSWTAKQHQLFQTRSLHDRAPFGLHLQDSEPLSIEDTERYAITFSPDLLTAEVERVLPYEIEIGNEISQTLFLRETSQYRLGQDRWLLSPPDEEFWGDEASLRGTRIDLTYRERDKDLARRLLPDLDRKLEALCNALPGACGPALQIKLDLSIDPQALIDAARPAAALAAGNELELVLATPTLVGIPEDEAGYGALFRGYAAQMATAVIAQHVGYACCAKLPVFQALVDFQLSQLGLKAWPVSETDYERVIREQLSFRELSAAWRNADTQYLTGPDGWRAYVLVDYLLDTVPEADALILLGELSRQQSLQGWLSSLLEDEEGFSRSATISALKRGLWGRGYESALNSAGDWQSGRPQQNVFLACTTPAAEGEEARRSILYLYDIGEDTWQTVYETSNLLWITPLAGDEKLLQQEYGEESRWAAYVRKEDQLHPLLPAGEDYVITFGQADPEAGGVAAFVFPPGGDEATITWFDLLNCDETSGCPNRELPGIPLWAPSGERALFTSEPSAQFNLLHRELQTFLVNRRSTDITNPLFVGERREFLAGEAVTSADELTPIGMGHGPFWIDNDSVVYVASEGTPVIQHGSQVMVRHVDEEDAQTLFTLDDMLAALDNGVAAERLFWIHYLRAHPDNPNRLFVVVLSAFNQLAHVLSFDRTSGEADYLMSSGFLADHSLGFSPDGRYLVLSGIDNGDVEAGEESVFLQVYDLEARRVMPFLTLAADFPQFSTYDWSLDGEWLAMLLDEGSLGFFAPAQEMLRVIETPPGKCSAPAWTNH